jgi:hypothetical protein
MEMIQLEEFPVDSLRVGSEINVIVGEAKPDIVELMFRPLPDEEWDPAEVFIQAPRDITWPKLLASLGCFPSTSQAKKNWCENLGRESEIRCGFEEISIGKARKITIFIYKPFLAKDVRKSV